MSLETTLSKIPKIIDEWNSGAYLSLDKLLELARKLGQCHFELTIINIDAYKEHNSILYNFNGSVARAQIEADKQVPQLRMTRKLLRTVEYELQRMNQEVSILRRDK